jgi:hypothetical protein
MPPGLRLLESVQGIGAAVVAAGLLGGAAEAGSLGSIGGAESVVNEVKGNLAPSKVVAVLRGDDVYRDEEVRTVADSSARLVLRDETVLTAGPSSMVNWTSLFPRGQGQLDQGRAGFRYRQRGEAFLPDNDADRRARGARHSVQGRGQRF